MFFLLALVFLALGVQAEEVKLFPQDADPLGQWAKVVQALRLFPTSPRPVRYTGPALATQLWGEVNLGRARYALLLGVTPANEVELWLDLDKDGRITAEEKLSRTPLVGGYKWTVTLSAEPGGGSPFDYPLEILWPAGRSYVFVAGGAPRAGVFRNLRVVVVDADLDGVFGTNGDFVAVDVDGDGQIYAEPDGHERFAIREAITIGRESFRVESILPDGRALRFSPASYVPPKPPLIPGSPAPNFAFREFRSGSTLSLSDFRGKVVLLDFWATWCTPCMLALPALLEIYEEFHAQGFEIIGVSLDESAEALSHVLSTYGIRWPVAFEGKRWDNSLAALYRVYQIPTLFLLDKKGLIRYRDVKGEALRKVVAELLAEPIAGTSAEDASSTPVGLLPVALVPEPVLEIRVPNAVGVRPGGTTAFSLEIVNTSSYLVEEVQVTATALPPGVILQGPRPFNIPAFGARTVEVQLTAQGLAQEHFPTSARFRVDYHYCPADACFQMAQEAEITLVLGAGTAAGFALPWWILLALGVGVLLSWVLFGRGLSLFALVLVGLAAAVLVLGIRRGQALQAQRIARVLCTSCVGLEEASPRAGEVPVSLLAEFQRISKPVRLVLFYTSWCKTCPYAKAVVERVAAANPMISVELVDAEEARDLAESVGVRRGGKTVVPAVLLRESGKVLFGVQDLAGRLLSALKEIP